MVIVSRDQDGDTIEVVGGTLIGSTLSGKNSRKFRSRKTPPPIPSFATWDPRRRRSFYFSGATATPLS